MRVEGEDRWRDTLFPEGWLDPDFDPEAGPPVRRSEARGRRSGFRRARDRRAELLVDDGWIDVALAGEPFDVVNNVGSILLPRGHAADRGFLQRDTGQFEEPEEVFAWSGTSVLLRRAYLEEVGLFDPRLFAYYEDLDLAWRGRARGWRYLYVPGSVVRHAHAATSIVGSAFFDYHVERNRLLVSVKNAPAAYALGAVGESLRVTGLHVERDVVRRLACRQASDDDVPPPPGPCVRRIPARAPQRTPSSSGPPTGDRGRAVARTGAEVRFSAVKTLVCSDVWKTFRLPHDRPSTLKQRVLHPRRSRAATTLHALRDVSFDVDKGEFFGVIGRNGSGKSSLLKCVAGIYEPTRGTIDVAGRISPFIELGVGFNPELTALDNVVVNAALLGISPAQARARFDDVIRFAELEEFVDLKLKNYSSGMYVRLGFAAAIQAQADVYLVDEVLAVGDARFQEKCFDTFRRLKREERTVIFVTHDLSAVERFCDRALLLERGEVAAIGDPREVTRVYREHNLAEEQAEAPRRGRRRSPTLGRPVRGDRRVLARGLERPPGRAAARPRGGLPRTRPLQRGDDRPDLRRDLQDRARRPRLRHEHDVRRAPDRPLRTR